MRRKSRKRVISEKTVVGSIVVPLWVFAVQAALQGEYFVAGAAAVIATTAFAAYHYLDVATIAIDDETLRELARELGESVREETEREE